MPYAKLEFPLAGMDISIPFERQYPRQLPSQEWGRTTRSAMNVVGWEQLSGRRRGGSRPCLSKYIPNSPVPGWILQELTTITTMGTGAVQASQSGRIVTLVTVSQGNVYYAAAGATTWTIAANTTPVSPPLNFSGIMFSTALNQKLWFADGINYCYFDPSLGQVVPWTASAGALYKDDAGNTPRLIATYRGRLVLSGLIYQPQNWFMTAVGDPTDFDTNPVPNVATQAVVGTNSPAGIIGDVVTGLVPFTDDLMVFGGDSSMWQLSGDPADGGKLDNISKDIGMAWGQAWARDPYGVMYFVSNKMGIYVMEPGAKPVRMSQPIEQLVQAYNTGTNTIRCQWNDKLQGMHIFISPTTAPAQTTHLFWEQRNGAWWPWQHGDTNHDPLCCTTFDGNLPGDRVALIGSWDGYVRFYDLTASTDDGTAVNSSVLLGPITSKELDDFMLRDLQAVLGTSSGDITYTIYTGATAEEAINNTPDFTGTWSAGRNFSDLVQRAGHAIYIKLSSSVPWQMEAIRAKIETKGIQRGRGK